MWYKFCQSEDLIEQGLANLRRKDPEYHDDLEIREHFDDFVNKNWQHWTTRQRAWIASKSISILKRLSDGEKFNDILPWTESTYLNSWIPSHGRAQAHKDRLVAERENDLNWVNQEGKHSQK